MSTALISWPAEVLLSEPGGRIYVRDCSRESMPLLSPTALNAMVRGRSAAAALGLLAQQLAG